MDGDNRRLKHQHQHQHHRHHDPSAFATRPAFGRRPVPRSAPDRFRPSAQQQTLQPGLAQTTGRPPLPRMPTYADYGYTDPSTFQDGALQPDELQPYAPPDFSRQHQRQQSQQHHQHHQHQHQQNQQLQPPFTPYEQPEMVYHHAQTPYEVVPQYPGPATATATGAGAGARQSASAAAAIEALSTQFAIPQYFQVPPAPPRPPTEPSGSGVVPPYLTPQQQQQQIPAGYNQPVGGRSTASQPFPAGSMADFTSTAARLDQQQQSPSQPHPQQQQIQQQPSSESLNVGEAYGQFQAALRGTFEHTRSGRLVEASRSLLEISEWLVGNAQELGILRDIDDQNHYTSRLTLWNDLNVCWLAVCQKQKDLTHELLQMGGGLGPFHHCSPTTGAGFLPLLAPDALEDLGSGLIQLCDKMEQHGLVDYQMGIWEEEILCSKVLTQCLDLMESRPDVLQGHTVAAAAAGTRS